jgi:hypothetical protein
MPLAWIETDLYRQSREKRDNGLRIRAMMNYHGPHPNSPSTGNNEITTPRIIVDVNQKHRYCFV